MTVTNCFLYGVGVFSTGSKGDLGQIGLSYFMVYFCLAPCKLRTLVYFSNITILLMRSLPLPTT